MLKRECVTYGKAGVSVAKVTSTVIVHRPDRVLYYLPEITETAAYDNQRYMISVIEALKNKGFCIAMDDFGTGYSSFGLLKEMPLDTLKIDKSFGCILRSGRCRGV